jgi:hypothetical protein
MSTATDALGVTLRVGDTVTVLHWGGNVRLSDCGRRAVLRGWNRANFLILDGFDKGVPTHAVAVARRDGLPGHEGNR